MKNNKLLISILFVVLLVGGWYTQIDAITQKNENYKNYLELGNKKYEDGLFQEAYEYYQQALSLKSSKELEDQLLAAYESFYKEQQSYDARYALISALEKARTNYPKEVDYWVREIELYLEADEYKDALTVCKKAVSEGISSNRMTELRMEIKYAYDVDTEYRSEYRNAVNGYFVAATGTEWSWVSGDGSQKSDMIYRNLGIVGDDNIFLCEAPEGNIYYSDIDNVKRGVAELEVSDFGLYSEGYCSVKYQDAYAFIDLEGNILVKGLQASGSFQNGYAPVQSADGKWGMAGLDGEIQNLEFDDIRYDHAGRYLFSDSIIASKDGYYQFYDSGLSKQLNDFKCKDIDIPTDDGILAFQNEKGLWGYVDYEGNVRIEPQYENAKSFSNGLAAVCKDGKWGYINKENTVVVNFEYFDCGYLSDGGVCYVSPEMGFYTMLIFKFPELIS